MKNILSKMTNRKIKIISAMAVLVSLLNTACGPSLKISSDYDRTADFSTFRTYSIYDLKSKGAVNELNRDRIVKYIRQEMNKKGLDETNTNPDLMINAVTVLKNKTGLSASTNYYEYGGFYRPYRFWGLPASAHTNITTYDYKDGSLVIDVIDAKTKKMIWQGAGYAEINKNPKDPEEAIGTTVARIMAGFPVYSASN